MANWTPKWTGPFYITVENLVLSDKNSRNYVLYQGTPSDVPQGNAPMIAKAFRP
jgi:hypothetical protein